MKGEGDDSLFRRLMDARVAGRNAAYLRLPPHVPQDMHEDEAEEWERGYDEGIGRTPRP